VSSCLADALADWLFTSHSAFVPDFLFQSTLWLTS
jgi:hypothetical protein